MVKWGYISGKGRYYQRVTGTKRFPDSGRVMSGNTTLSKKEIVGKHHYGSDAKKPKKTISKIYRRHKVKGTNRYRGGYRRSLR